jgi:hypothetical protein
VAERRRDLGVDRKAGRRAQRTLVGTATLLHDADMTELLAESVNPIGNIQAVVEADERACFFYLRGAPETEFGMKSVWVRNHVPAPARLNVKAMRQGQPPINPKTHTRHEGGRPPLRQQDLRIVWLPEGNGAALYERDSPIAIIPPWSGVEGFHGYASECVGEGPLAWELSEDNLLIERFTEAQKFWSAWDDDQLWPNIRDELCEMVEAALGQHSNYYAIDGGNWPPKALLRIPRSGHVALVTVGVSILPQPGVEMHQDDPRPFRRIELGAILPSSWSEPNVQRFANYLSAQARLPWSQYTWLGPNHTIPCDSWNDPAFSAALLVRDHPSVGAVDLGVRFSDPVSPLWFIPITDAERELAMAQGSEALRQHLPLDRWGC